MAGQEESSQFIWERPTAGAPAEGYPGSAGERWSLREAVSKGGYRDKCTALICFSKLDGQKIYH